MKSFCYVNGSILPTDQGTVPVTDLGLQRGYGVFDYGRTYHGRLFHFEENVARFRRSAAELHLEVPASDQEIRDIAEQLIEQSDLRNPSIRLLLTGGDTTGSPAPAKPNFMVIAEEMFIYPEEAYREGAGLITVEFQRELPQVKSINYLNSIRLEPLRKAKGAFDILYHSHHGITECPRSNFFAFVGDTLVTPADHVLLGVTRKLVLKLAAEEFSIEERELRMEEIGQFTEAFVTSTSKKIVPVTRIDDQEIGSGRVGERTGRLMQLFDDYTESY